MNVVTLGLGDEGGLLLTLLLVEVGVVLLARVLEELLTCDILWPFPCSMAQAERQFFFELICVLN